MSKNRIVLTIGILLIILPFLGFPSRYENFFVIILGLGLIVLSVSNSIKRRSLKDGSVSHYRNSFSEEAVSKIDIKSTIDETPELNEKA
jgi:hypothetical protein